MAWADITTYTAAEVDKVKAELDEVIALIDVKIAAHKHRNGTHTDEEHYALLFKESVLVPRSLELGIASANLKSVAVVKALVEGATYTMLQAEAAEEAAVKAEIEAIIADLELDGVAVEVTKESYTPAVAGTVEDQDGTNGSYKFTAELAKGDATATTAELTMTITATPHSA